MDIQSYIKSGRVEHYVLGLASTEDTREIERFAAEFPEFQAEINRVHEALGKLASAAAIQPPSGLKERVMTEIDRISSGMPEKPRSKPVDAAKKPEPNRPQSTEPFLATAKTTSIAWAWGWLAAGLIAAGAGYLYKINSDVQSKLNTETTRADEAVAKFEALDKDCSARQAKEDNLKKQIAFARDPATKSVVMRGVEKSPNSLASVIFNANKREAYIEVNSLPAAPTGKQYQLWAIRGEEKVSMGVFDVPKSADEHFAVPYVDNVDAFAVTLENQGGSPVPTLEEMYVVGAVDKPKLRRRQSTTPSDNG